MEFWNVCTRPANKNGFGLTGAEADIRAKLIESRFTLLPETARIHTEWRRLAVVCSVAGVQVHDARLATAMLAQSESADRFFWTTLHHVWFRWAEVPVIL